MPCFLPVKTIVAVLEICQCKIMNLASSNGRVLLSPESIKFGRFGWQWTAWPQHKHVGFFQTMSVPGNTKSPPTTTSTPSDDEVLGQVALCWWCWTCLSFWQKRLGDRWWGKDAVRFFLVRLGHGMTAQLLSYLWQGDRGLHYWYHCCPCSVSHHVFSFVLLLKLVLWWVGSHDTH